MPYSSPIFDEVTKAIVQILSPQRVLDIGCGAGKHGELVRAAAPAANIIGVEVEQSYIQRFKLDLTYDDVRLLDATTLITTDIEELYDLVIIGDCIEHLPKSAALDLLNFFAYRAAYTLVICPESVFQDSVEGVKSEAHISVWSARDFEWHDLWATTSIMQMMVFVLRGYAQYPVTLPELVQKINRLELPLHARKFTKTCQLELQNRVRTELVDGKSLSFRCL